MEFTIIEQADDFEAYVTHISAKDAETALNMYESLGNGCMIIISQAAYSNMALMGTGAH
jgi:hypothetical protein